MLTNGIMADVIRGPFLIVACSIQKRIIVRDDKLEIAPMLRLGISADHRFVDLNRANEFVRYVKKNRATIHLMFYNRLKILLKILRVIHN